MTPPIKRDEELDEQNQADQSRMPEQADNEEAGERVDRSTHLEEEDEEMDDDLSDDLGGEENELQDEI
jgi:hypothetical protein